MHRKCPSGLVRLASKSTLSDANNKQDFRIFEEFDYHIVAAARVCRADDIFKFGGIVYTFDSTTIGLCLETFKWLKQHFKINNYGATPKNVFRIQIYSAIITYCLMALIQKGLAVGMSIYYMLQIVSV